MSKCPGKCLLGQTEITKIINISIQLWRTTMLDLRVALLPVEQEISAVYSGEVKVILRKTPLFIYV
jgi:hypothetical protein